MSENTRMHDEFLEAYDTHADALFRFVLLRTRDRENAVECSRYSPRDIHAHLAVFERGHQHIL